MPTVDDEARHRREPQYDIFGRDRLDEEGRTKGAGAISRDSTTLYIYLGGAATQPQDLLQKALEASFSEWGLIDEINVISSKAIAFVRYVFRSNAEFAKAAMHQQTLKGITADHVLDVRWANDDPNPRARARVKRAQEEAMAKAYLETLSNMEPEAKRARLHELSLGSAYRPGSVAAAYPDTSDQYADPNTIAEYEGWDVRAHAEVSGDGGKATTAQDAAIREYQEKIWGPGKRGQEQHQGPGGGIDGDLVEDVEDDINRYLPLDDNDDEAALEYPEELTEPVVENLARPIAQQAQQHDGDEPLEQQKAPEEEQDRSPGGIENIKAGGGRVDDSEKSSQGGNAEESGDALGLQLLGGYGSDSD